MREMFLDDIKNFISSNVNCDMNYKFPVIACAHIIKKKNFNPFEDKSRAKLTIGSKFIQLLRRGDGQYGFNDKMVNDLLEYYYNLFKKTQIFSIYIQKP